MSFRNRTLTDALAASVPAGEQPGRGRFRPASPAETRSRRRGGPRPGDADDIRSRGRCSRIGRRPACAAALQPANLAQCLNSQRQRGFNAMASRPACQQNPRLTDSLTRRSLGRRLQSDAQSGQRRCAISRAVRRSATGAAPRATAAGDAAKAASPPALILRRSSRPGAAPACPAARCGCVAI